jgi:channel protein (hemolysin III family)
MDEITSYAIPGFREPVCCFSHLLAAPVFAVLGFVLVKRGRGHRGRTASLAVMAFSTVFLLSMSGVYHMLGEGAGRWVMRVLDISGVFALIAGTATPVHAILFRGISRWGPLLLFWGMAATGISLRAVFVEGLPRGAGTAIFVLMGWGGLYAGVVLWRRYGSAFIRPLIWGGIAYTAGAVCLVAQWPTLIPGVVGPHEVWHGAVLVGLTLHWKFVWQFAAGPPDASSKPMGNSQSM